MPEEYIFSLQKAGKIRRIGRKAQNLRFLATQGFSVPKTYVCTWEACERYAGDGVQVIETLRTELEAKLDAGTKYAIRSSANLEDGLDSSFAGQFESLLNVQGVDQILQAISSIWATTQSAAVQAYLGQKGSASRDLKMAVIIQEMVSARVSGVAFSKNPITGLDEIVVEAVRGSGEALVQGGVTPERWISKWGAWTSKPDEPLDGQGIALELIEDVVRQT
ncbi:MAG: PEP/pyruvate-binding domain-containing protein, partial [Anaerolineae bacterium]